MATIKEIFETLNTKTNKDCNKAIPSFLEGMGITPKSFVNEREHFYDIEPFFEHEHLLTKPEIFWWFCSFAYSIGGRWDERWLDVFSRYDRLDHHFNDKLKWCNGFRLDQTVRFYDFLKKKRQDDDLTVSRTFRVRKGHAVRKGVKKLDNPDALIQEEGMGSSFSFSKIFAYWFLNHHYHNYFYKKYGGITDREEQLRQIKIGWEGSLSNEGLDLMLGDDSYAAVGVLNGNQRTVNSDLKNGSPLFSVF